MEQQSLLLLPGTPEYHLTLAAMFPPGWRNVASHTGGEFAFVARAGSGLLEAVPWSEALDYMEGGEWDERLEEIGEGDEDELEPGSQSDGEWC